MKCPHCLTSFHSDPKGTYLGHDVDGGWTIAHETCPSCKRIIVLLIGSHAAPSFPKDTTTLVYPKGFARTPLPPDIPAKYSDDYREACLVFPDSPKASAALSRRCIQHILRDKALVKPGDLSTEIRQLLDSNQLPSRLAESVDAIRNIGNFAAHPMKSTNTGEIVTIEPGEAEWCLDVLEELFDFYFIQPERLKAKKAALDAKLSDAGKPPMKS